VSIQASIQASILSSILSSIQASIQSSIQSSIQASFQASSALIAVAGREREIARHGELEEIQGKEKDRFIDRGKRKRCSISSCSKKSDGSARFVERRCVTGEIADMKETEQEAGWC
jgi:uncharacterized protein Veg